MGDIRAIAINDIYFMVQDCFRPEHIYMHYYSEQFKAIAATKGVELNQNNCFTIERLFYKCKDSLTDLAWYHVERQHG